MNYKINTEIILTLKIISITSQIAFSKYCIIYTFICFFKWMFLKWFLNAFYRSFSSLMTLFTSETWFFLKNLCVKMNEVDIMQYYLDKFSSFCSLNIALSNKCIPQGIKKAISNLGQWVPSIIFYLGFYCGFYTR